jgi:hypothetical protein
VTISSVAGVPGSAREMIKGFAQWMMGAEVETRTVNVHALIATGVNADGKREILGLDVATAEDGARVAGVLALPGRPRPFWGPAGHQ